VLPVSGGDSQRCLQALKPNSLADSWHQLTHPTLRQGVPGILLAPFSSINGERQLIDNSLAPRTLAWLAELVNEGYLPSGMQHTVALGMANDQAKVEFYRTEHLPLPLIYLQEQQLINSLRSDVLGVAEEVAHQLWGAARTMATYVLALQADSENAHQPAPEDLNRLTAAWGIERRYWSKLEVPFRLALEGLPQDREGTLIHWQSTLQHTAWEAFDDVAHDIEADARTLKATVQGRDQLAAGLAKVLPA